MSTRFVASQRRANARSTERGRRRPRSHWRGAKPAQRVERCRVAIPHDDAAAFLRQPRAMPRPMPRTAR
jgi:hypothetical protein